MDPKKEGLSAGGAEAKDAIGLDAEHNPTPGASQACPDTDEAERFLCALDPDATFFTFQSFDDDRARNDKRLAQIIHGGLGSCWPRLVHLNEQGAVKPGQNRRDKPHARPSPKPTEQINQNDDKRAGRVASQKQRYSAQSDRLGSPAPKALLLCIRSRRSGRSPRELFQIPGNPRS